MNSAATIPTVTPSTQNPKQPQPRQTAKEVIAANVQSLIEQLEAGHSDALTAYLNAMSRFHSYSFGNVLEIARQRPTATKVAGMYAWNQLGRRVKKGEKGIRILAPIIGIKRKPDAEAEKDITKQNTRVLVGFRNAYVFDVEQTEGVELPAMREVYGFVGENHDRLLSFIERQGIELVFTEKIAPALGMSYGGRIAILPGQSKAETFATLLHELAHEMLHKAERRTTTTKVVRDGKRGESHRAGLVQCLDDKLHVRSVIDLEVQAGVPPSGLLENVENGFHYATLASSASGIVSSAADDSKAARMTAEVCWMTSSDSINNEALP